MKIIENNFFRKVHTFFQIQSYRFLTFTYILFYFFLFKNEATLAEPQESPDFFFVVVVVLNY